MKRFFTVAAMAILVFCLASGAWAGREQVFEHKATFQGDVVVEGGVLDCNGEMLARGQGVAFGEDFLTQNASNYPGVPHVATIGYPLLAVQVGNATGLMNSTWPLYYRVDLKEVHGADAVALTSTDDFVNANASAYFVSRVRFARIPNGTAEMQFGLANNHAPGSWRLAYDLDGSGAVNIQAWNNSVQYNGSSGVTVSAGEWHTFVINCRDVEGVEFEIDGKSVGTATTRSFHTAAGSTAHMLALFATANKTSSGTVRADIDYLRVWQNR